MTGEYFFNQMKDRHDALKNDMLSEIGRLTYHLENYGMQDSTRACTAAKIHMLKEFLATDQQRS